MMVRYWFRQSSHRLRPSSWRQRIISGRRIVEIYACWPGVYQAIHRDPKANPPGLSSRLVERPAKRLDGSIASLLLIAIPFRRFVFVLRHSSAQALDKPRRAACIPSRTMNKAKCMIGLAYREHASFELQRRR